MNFFSRVSQSCIFDWKAIYIILLPPLSSLLFCGNLVTSSVSKKAIATSHVMGVTHKLTHTNHFEGVTNDVTASNLLRNA